MCKIIVALDYNNPLDALEMASKLRGKVDGFKINHMLWEQSEYLRDCGELFVDFMLFILVFRLFLGVLGELLALV